MALYNPPYDPNYPNGVKKRPEWFNSALGSIGDFFSGDVNQQNGVSRQTMNPLQMDVRNQPRQQASQLAGGIAQEQRNAADLHSQLAGQDINPPGTTPVSPYGTQPGNSLGVIPFTPRGNQAVTNPDGSPAPEVTGAVPAPQDLARQKQLQAQAINNKANRDMQQNVINGGTPAMTSPKDDPGAHMAERNNNLSRGIGDATGSTPVQTPEVPTDNENKTAGIAQQGAQASFEQNKVPTWYKSQSFGLGLMTFGLSLLSGQDLIHSFAAGSGTFTQARGQEQRQAHRDELIAQGIPEYAVDQYIQTGDDKALEAPSDLNLKQAQAQHEWAQIPLEQQKAATSQFTAENTAAHNQVEEAHWANADMNDQIKNNIAMTKNGIEINKNMPKQQQAQIFGMADPDAVQSTLGRIQTNKTLTDSIARVQLAGETVDNFNSAITDLQNGKNDSQTMAQARLGAENLGKMIKGGYGGITESQFKIYSGNPSAAQAALDWVKQGATGVPTVATLQVLRAVAQGAQKDRMKTIQSNYDSTVNMLTRQGVPPQNAGNIALQAFPTIANTIKIYQPQAPQAPQAPGMASADNIQVLN